MRPGIPRPAEATVALVGLIASAPILAAAAAVIAITSPGPALFRQERVGRGGRVFILYKLRTMQLSAGGPEVTARDDARVTWFGRLLRRAKLDELPQFWNVLRGDMALVGPRPEVPRYVDPKDPLWSRVLQTRPGLTDPVTLTLKNEAALLARVEADREAFYLKKLQPWKLRQYLAYLRRRNWRTDLSVLLRTAGAVFSPRGPSESELDEMLESEGR